MKALDLLTIDPKHRASAILTASLRVYPHQVQVCRFMECVADAFDRRQRPSRYGHGFERRDQQPIMPAHSATPWVDWATERQKQSHAEKR